MTDLPDLTALLNSYGWPILFLFALWKGILVWGHEHAREQQARIKAERRADLMTELALKGTVLAEAFAREREREPS